MAEPNFVAIIIWLFLSFLSSAPFDAISYTGQYTFFCRTSLSPERITSAFLPITPSGFPPPTRLDPGSPLLSVTAACHQHCAAVHLRPCGQANPYQISDYRHPLSFTLSPSTQPLSVFAFCLRRPHLPILRLLQSGPVRSSTYHSPFPIAIFIQVEAFRTRSRYGLGGLRHV